MQVVLTLFSLAFIEIVQLLKVHPLESTLLVDDGIQEFVETYVEGGILLQFRNGSVVLSLGPPFNTTFKH